LKTHSTRASPSASIRVSKKTCSRASAASICASAAFTSSLRAENVVSAFPGPPNAIARAARSNHNPYVGSTRFSLLNSNVTTASCPTRSGAATFNRQRTRRKFNHDNTPLSTKHPSNNASVMNKMLFPALYAASPIPNDSAINNTPDAVSPIRCVRRG